MAEGPGSRAAHYREDRNQRDEGGAQREVNPPRPHPFHEAPPPNASRTNHIPQALPKCLEALSTFA